MLFPTSILLPLLLCALPSLAHPLSPHRPRTSSSMCTAPASSCPAYSGCGSTYSSTSSGGTTTCEYDGNYLYTCTYASNSGMKTGGPGCCPASITCSASGRRRTA